MPAGGSKEKREKPALLCPNKGAIAFALRDASFGRFLACAKSHASQLHSRSCAMSRRTGPMLLSAIVMGLISGSAQPEPPKRDLGEKYALLVGIRAYRSDSALRDLEFTERDVEQLAVVLGAA